MENKPFVLGGFLVLRTVVAAPALLGATPIVAVPSRYVLDVYVVENVAGFAVAGMVLLLATAVPYEPAYDPYALTPVAAGVAAALVLAMDVVAAVGTPDTPGPAVVR